MTGLHPCRTVITDHLPHYDPYGDTPPTDFLGSLDTDVSHARVLLLGSDPWHILASLAAAGARLHLHAVDVAFVEKEPVAVARAALLLLLASELDPKSDSDMTLLWHVWNNELWPEGTWASLKPYLARLAASVPWLVLETTGQADKVSELWHDWLNDTYEQYPPNEHITELRQQAADLFVTKHKLCERLFDELEEQWMWWSLNYVREVLSDSERLQDDDLGLHSTVAFMDWVSCGSLWPEDNARPRQGPVNVTLFDKLRQVMHPSYHSNPVRRWSPFTTDEMLAMDSLQSAFAKLSIAKIRLLVAAFQQHTTTTTTTSTASGQRQGRKVSLRVFLHCMDPLQFCCETVAALGDEGRSGGDAATVFHVIETGSLCDRVGLLPLLVSATPRLAHNRGSRIRTEVRTWGFVTDNIKDYMCKYALGLPVQLFPTMLGLRLVTDIEHGSQGYFRCSDTQYSERTRPWLLEWAPATAVTGARAPWPQPTILVNVTSEQAGHHAQHPSSTDGLHTALSSLVRVCCQPSYPSPLYSEHRAPLKMATPTTLALLLSQLSGRLHTFAQQPLTALANTCMSLGMWHCQTSQFQAAINTVRMSALQLWPNQPEDQNTFKPLPQQRWCVQLPLTKHWPAIQHSKPQLRAVLLPVGMVLEPRPVGKKGGKKGAVEMVEVVGWTKKAAQWALGLKTPPDNCYLWDGLEVKLDDARTPTSLWVSFTAPSSLERGFLECAIAIFDLSSAALVTQPVQLTAKCREGLEAASDRLARCLQLPTAATEVSGPPAGQSWYLDVHHMTEGVAGYHVHVGLYTTLAHLVDSPPSLVLKLSHAHKDPTTLTTSSHVCVITSPDFPQFPPLLLTFAWPVEVESATAEVVTFSTPTLDRDGYHVQNLTFRLRKAQIWQQWPQGTPWTPVLDLNPLPRTHDMVYSTVKPNPKKAKRRETDCDKTLEQVAAVVRAVLGTHDLVTHHTVYTSAETLRANKPQVRLYTSGVVKQLPDGQPVMPVLVVDVRLLKTLGKLEHLQIMQRVFIKSLATHHQQLNMTEEQLTLLMRLLWRNAQHCLPDTSLTSLLNCDHNSPHQSPFLATYLSLILPEHPDGPGNCEPNYDWIYARRLLASSIPPSLRMDAVYAPALNSNAGPPALDKASQEYLFAPWDPVDPQQPWYAFIGGSRPPQSQQGSGQPSAAQHGALTTPCGHQFGQPRATGAQLFMPEDSHSWSDDVTTTATTNSRTETAGTLPLANRSMCQAPAQVAQEAQPPSRTLADITNTSRSDHDSKTAACCASPPPPAGMTKHTIATCQPVGDVQPAAHSQQTSTIQSAIVAAAGTSEASHCTVGIRNDPRSQIHLATMMNVQAVWAAVSSEQWPALCLGSSTAGQQFFLQTASLAHIPGSVIADTANAVVAVPRQPLQREQRLVLALGAAVAIMEHDVHVVNMHFMAVALCTVLAAEQAVTAGWVSTTKVLWAEMRRSVCAAGCRRYGPGLFKCAGCGQLSYCSKRCQVEHWRAGHKHMCKALVDGAQRRSLPAATQQASSSTPAAADAATSKAEQGAQPVPDQQRMHAAASQQTKAEDAASQLVERLAVDCLVNTFMASCCPWALQLTEEVQEQPPHQRALRALIQQVTTNASIPGDVRETLRDLAQQQQLAEQEHHTPAQPPPPEKQQHGSSAQQLPPEQQQHDSSAQQQQYTPPRVLQMWAMLLALLQTPVFYAYSHHAVPCLLSMVWHNTSAPGISHVPAVTDVLQHCCGWCGGACGVVACPGCDLHYCSIQCQCYHWVQQHHDQCNILQQVKVLAEAAAGQAAAQNRSCGGRRCEGASIPSQVEGSLATPAVLTALQEANDSLSDHSSRPDQPTHPDTSQTAPLPSHADTPASQAAMGSTSADNIASDALRHPPAFVDLISLTNGTESPLHTSTTELLRWASLSQTHAAVVHISGRSLAGAHRQQGAHPAQTTEDALVQQLCGSADGLSSLKDQLWLRDSTQLDMLPRCTDALIALVTAAMLAAAQPAFYGMHSTALVAWLQRAVSDPTAHLLDDVRKSLLSLCSYCGVQLPAHLDRNSTEVVCCGCHSVAFCSQECRAHLWDNGHRQACGVLRHGCEVVAAEAAVWDVDKQRLSGVCGLVAARRIWRQQPCFRRLLSAEREFQRTWHQQRSVEAEMRALKDAAAAAAAAAAVDYAASQPAATLRTVTAGLRDTSEAAAANSTAMCLDADGGPVAGGSTTAGSAAAEEPDASAVDSASWVSDVSSDGCKTPYSADYNEAEKERKHQLGFDLLYQAAMLMGGELAALAEEAKRGFEELAAEHQND